MWRHGIIEPTVPQDLTIHILSYDHHIKNLPFYKLMYHGKFAPGVHDVQIWNDIEALVTYPLFTVFEANDIQWNLCKPNPE